MTDVFAVAIPCSCTSSTESRATLATVLVALNTSLHRGRRRLGALLSTVVLSLAVVSAHGAVAGGHMAPMSSGQTPVAGGVHVMGTADATSDPTAAAPEPGGTMMAMCLALAQTAALTLGALALAGALAALHLLGSTVRRPTPRLVLTPRAARAPRARPPDLSVLQVFRR